MSFSWICWFLWVVPVSSLLWVSIIFPRLSFAEMMRSGCSAPLSSSTSMVGVGGNPTALTQSEGSSLLWHYLLSQSWYGVPVLWETLTFTQRIYFISSRSGCRFPDQLVSVAALKTSNGFCYVSIVVQMIHLVHRAQDGCFYFLPASAAAETLGPVLQAS